MSDLQVFKFSFDNFPSEYNAKKWSIAVERALPYKQTLSSCPAL